MVHYLATQMEHLDPTVPETIDPEGGGDGGGGRQQGEGEGERGGDRKRTLLF